MFFLRFSRGQELIRRMFQPRNQPVILRAGVLLLLPALSLCQGASARADGALVGVPGWTSGSQTFIRARPSALTPPVAKVPTRTPVYVWGRYEDWYRVETKDHIFGWVHKDYIDARRLRKVRPISHFKAKEASDKTSNQTMFGTPEQLKTYRARYGGSGAVKGLALKGIYIATKPKPASVRVAKVPATRSMRVAQAPRTPIQRLRNAIERQRLALQKSRVKVAINPAPKAAPRVRVAANPVAKTATRVNVSAKSAPQAALPHVRVAKAAPWVPVTPAQAPDVDLNPSSGGTLLSPPTPQELGTDRNAGDDLRVAPDALAPDASSLAARVRSWNPSPIGVAPSSPRVNPASAAGSRGKSPVMAPPVAIFTAPRAPFAARPRVNGGAMLVYPAIVLPRAPVAPSEARTPLAPVMAGNNVLMTTAPAVSKATPEGPSLEQLHIVAWQTRKRAKEQKWKWLQLQKVNQWKWRQAQAQKRAAQAQLRRQQLAKIRQNRYAYVSSRKGDQRKKLIAREGLIKQLPPNVPGGTIAPMPISSEEILRARERYLKKNQSQAASQVAPIPADPGSPFVPSGLSSPAPLRGLTKKLSVLLFGSRQQKTQTAQELSASSAASESLSRYDASPSAASTTTSSMPVPFPVPSAPVQPSSVALSRGGSPRDRAALAWRSGVATQALSYRGMPYRFGAASPSRGFDCSGLIYFLLRQRGLNPPRTAAGYRTYGQAVARGRWQAGDLILFANTYKHGISHIGVYLKDGKFVHAASTGQGVRVDSLQTGYFASKYWGARRVN